MFSWAIAFLVIALIAAALGFGGVAGTAIVAAKLIYSWWPSSRFSRRSRSGWRDDRVDPPPARPAKLDAVALRR